MIDDNPSPKLQVLLTASIKLVTQMIPHHETVRFFLLFFSSNGREKKNPQKHRQPLLLPSVRPLYNFFHGEQFLLMTSDVMPALRSV